MKLSTTRIQLVPKRLPKLICGIAIAGIIGLSSCTSSDSPPQEYTEETVVDAYTQGVITEVAETEKDVFKITDETTVPTKEESRVIASYLDGSRDTFTLEEIALVDTDSTKSDYRRRSGMSSVVTGGLMGYFLGRSMSSPTNRSSYMNSAAHAKSTTTNSALRSTAKTSTVKTPAKTPSRSSTGYGGGKSTKSYGG